MNQPRLSITTERSTFHLEPYPGEDRTGVPCENNTNDGHADAFLPLDAVLYRANVIPAAADETPWELAATADGWTVGDEKVMIAFCPTCSAAAYEMPEDVMLAAGWTRDPVWGWVKASA
jgi:hypothetical protein